MAAAELEAALRPACRQVPVTQQASYRRPALKSAEWLGEEEARRLEGSFRYVCFNNMYKVTPESLSAWAAVRLPPPHPSLPSLPPCPLPPTSLRPSPPRPLPQHRTLLRR